MAKATHPTQAAAKLIVEVFRVYVNPQIVSARPVLLPSSPAPSLPLAAWGMEQGGGEEGGGAAGRGGERQGVLVSLRRGEKGEVVS